MATIELRNSGRWQAKIRRRGVIISETFGTKSDADAWARKTESEIERGLWRDSTEAESTTLREALDRYQREKTTTKKSAEKEKYFVSQLAEESIARKSLASIRGADIAALRDDWLKAVSPSTVVRRLVVLSHVFTVAAKEWGMESLQNPVSKIQRPKVDDARERRVSDVEIEAICAASRSEHLPALVRLAVSTAMRRGEIVGLRLENVDLGRRVAHLADTKNGAARDVPLSVAAVAVLTGLQGAGKIKRKAGPVFWLPGDDGPRQMTENAVTLAFQRAVDRARKAYEKECKKAETEPDPAHLVDLRYHDLRHEATSRLAEKLQMHELMKVIGHKSPRMLARYYHPRAEDLARKLG